MDRTLFAALRGSLVATGPWLPGSAAPPIGARPSAPHARDTAASGNRDDDLESSRGPPARA